MILEEKGREKKKTNILSYCWNSPSQGLGSSLPVLSHSTWAQTEISRGWRPFCTVNLVVAILLQTVRESENMDVGHTMPVSHSVIKHSLVHLIYRFTDADLSSLYFKMLALISPLFVNCCQEESILAVPSQRYNHPLLQLLLSLIWFDPGVESAWYSCC